MFKFHTTTQKKTLRSYLLYLLKQIFLNKNIFNYIQSLALVISVSFNFLIHLFILSYFDFTYLDNIIKMEKQLVITN